MKVKIKEKGKQRKYKVITNWSDVTLERWAKLISIKSGTKSEEARDTIAALSDIPKKLIDKLELYHIAAIMQALGTMQREEKTCLREVIEIDGKEYGFHPDLESLTLGEYADLETYLKDMENNMAEIMAILFRPVVAKEGDFYQIEAYDGEIKLRTEVMRKISADKVQDALVFFYNFAAILLPTMLSFLTKELRETIQQ
tara:strand:+ start:702 stop:1298 length:597 start_codon:yes stop_codon:yes gene_type:complete